MNTRKQIASNLEDVKATLKEAEMMAGNTPGTVTLVAVSKTQPPETVRLAIESGHSVFGENRVQEAMEKWPALLETYDNIQLHLIGALQSNKVRQALRQFDVIETVDRPNLARALARNMDTLGLRPECFVQVNTGKEPQKAGVLPQEADIFIRSCREDFQLPVTGLMCIPPAEEEPSPHFIFLAKIAQQNGLKKISMGMSSDYAIAVSFGATHVRVGTAIFGPRQDVGKSTYTLKNY